jgi:hypothetical protein
MTDVVDDGDEIVREIDVVLTRSSLSSSMHFPLSLLQFPLRPVFAESPHIEECKFKPINKRLRMDIVSGPISQLHTSAVVCPNANLCVGVMRSGTLNISPLSDVYQMRPCFDEVDFDFEEEVGTPLETVEDKVASIQQVHVRPKESDRARATKEQSYTYLKKKEDEESFVPMVVETTVASNAVHECLYFRDKEAMDTS